MEQFGPALVTAGMALLCIPLAEMMGSFGYVLFGGGFLLVGSVLTFAPGYAVGDTSGTIRKNCPECGAPTEPDASVCTYCDTDLS